MARLLVSETGMVTAVGFNAASSCAAMRAGISGVAVSSLADPESGDMLPVGKVPLPQWSHGLEKLADLVAPAIQECLTAAVSETDRVPILLGIAAPDRFCRLPDLESRLLSEVERRLGVEHHPHSGVLPYGQVAGVHGLIAAERLMQEGRARMVVVAGVDSLIREDVVDAYYEERRIMTESNSNGFFPGEAGSAVLVEQSVRKGADQLEILGIGLAHENATIMSDLPCRAEGLTAAIRSSLEDAALTLADTDYRITDLSGEHYKFKEAAFAVARLDTGARPGVFDLWHPIEFIGEVGAAIVPCLLAVARDASRYGYAPGDTALCHAGSDDGQRAAFVVRYRRERGA